MDDQQVIHAMGLDDTYHVERTLASGPCGVTELVSLDGSGPFVRKRIPSKLARRGVWATLAECNCARLPRVEATYEMPDEFIVVCDFVPGENLEQLLGLRGHLSEKDAVSIVCQLCEAVSALHAHGIVHRDISPTNVIIAADGAHLIDFGIARFRVEGATRDTTQLGTYGFASPEQYGFAQTDARSDVYSLGRVLGYLLTGVSPEDADKYEAALADKNLVKPELCKIVLRASSLEPSARYQSADELVEALTGKPTKLAVGSESEKKAATTSSGFLQQHQQGLRANKAKIVLVAVAVAAFLVGLAAIVFQPGIIGGTQGQNFQTDARSGSSESLLSDSSVASNDSDSDSPSAKEGLSADDQTADSAIAIKESGWSVDSGGYVHYAVALENTGDNALQLVSFTITGKDEEGKVLFSSEQALSLIGSGETAYLGGIAGDGNPSVPTTVEFSPNGIQDFQVMGTSESDIEFSVSNTQAVPDQFGGTKFVGEVTTIQDSGADNSSGVAVTVVMRDESGAIVSGACAFAPRPEVGESTSFEIPAYNLPEYASFEIHAIPW